MDSYLILKLLHILSAVVVAGTGTGIAFFMFMANRSNNPQAVYHTANSVILGDWLFTAPAVVIQLITGWLLMEKLQHSYSSPWFFAVAGLVIFIGLCWLPVLYIQYRLRNIIKRSLACHEIPREFKQLMRIWTGFGIAAFSAILILFYLMVFKPLDVY